jgi:hypothetical protein
MIPIVQNPDEEISCLHEGRSEASRKIYKGIYLDEDVCKAMEKRRVEAGITFTFQVNKALRRYLGLKSD